MVCRTSSCIARAAAPILIACLLLLSACTSLPQSGGRGAAGGPPVGSTVAVQFRRDLLGGKTSSPVPPVSIPLNSDVGVKGKLIAINSEWVVLDADELGQGQGQLFIPRSAVLLIRADRSPTPDDGKH